MNRSMLWWLGAAVLTLLVGPGGGFGAQGQRVPDAVAQGPMRWEPMWFLGAYEVGEKDVTNPTLLKSVKAVLPPGVDFALSGTIIRLEARVEPDGSVENARVVEYDGRVAVPSMDKAAMVAATQFKFLPAHVNGTPVPIIVSIEVAFAPPINQKAN